MADMFDLAGRVALIVGGANILGPEFAKVLLQHRAKVVLADINGPKLEALAEELTFEDFHVADMSEPTDSYRVVEAVVHDFGGIDILINAAAAKPVGYFSDFEAYPALTWDRVMSVNVGAMFQSVKHIVPHMREQGGGVIVNVASHYGLVGPDERIYKGASYPGVSDQINTPAAYSASKGAVLSFTRWIATTQAKYGIRANALVPGGVYDMQAEEFVLAYSDKVPLQRMAVRSELQGPMLFLCSDASSYMNGQNLVIDGGLTAW